MRTFLDACREELIEHPGWCHLTLFVGEDNPQSSEPEHALYPHPPGCAGHRLQSTILDVPRDIYLSTWRTNLCNPTWDLQQARSRARQLLQPDAPWKLIVGVGRKVGKVFGLETWETVDVPGKRIMNIPHPSGRCREWNDPRAYHVAREFFKREVARVVLT